MQLSLTYDFFSGTSEIVIFSIFRWLSFLLALKCEDSKWYVQKMLHSLMFRFFGNSTYKTLQFYKEEMCCSLTTSFWDLTLKELAAQHVGHLARGSRSNSMMCSRFFPFEYPRRRRLLRNEKGCNLPFGCYKRSPFVFSLKQICQKNAF